MSIHVDNDYFQSLVEVISHPARSIHCIDSVTFLLANSPTTKQNKLNRANRKLTRISCMVFHRSAYKTWNFPVCCLTRLLYPILDGLCF